MNDSSVLNENIAEHFDVDNFLTDTDRKKIKEYLQKTPKQKQVFCSFWLRGLCIFPPNICPHAHGISDLKYIPLIERNESEKNFQINSEKSLNFEGGKNKYPLYIHLPSFQNEVMNDDSFQISKSNPLYTTEEFDKDYDKRYKIRKLFHNKLGLLLIEKFFSLSQHQKFFITKSFINHEFRRIKFNKKPSSIVFNSKFCFKGIVLPPSLFTPTEVLLLRMNNNLYETIEMEQKIVFHLKSEHSKEKRREILLEYLENIPLNKTIICDQWRRGFCEFQAEECRNAHGVDDLDPSVYVDENIKKNSLGLKEIEELFAEANIKKKKITKEKESSSKTNKNEIKNKGSSNDDEKKLIDKEENEKIDVKKENCNVPKIIKLKISNRNYSNYFNYQKELISKGIIHEDEYCSSINEITYNKEKKTWLRETIQKHEAIKFISIFFEKCNNQPLKKKFLENMFEKIAMKPPSSIYNCEKFYEISVPMYLNLSKKQKTIFLIKTSLEEMSEKIETKIKKVIEDLLKHQKKLSLSLITKAYYQNTSLSPTLIHFLKVKGVSLFEYLKELQEKKILNIENQGILSLEQEELLKNKAVFKEIEKFWIDNRKKAGFCKKNRLREFIEKNSKELTTLGNNEFDKILYENDIPIIHLQCGNFVINVLDFGQISKEKIQNKKKVLCEILKMREDEVKKLKNEKNIKLPIAFEKNIYIIDDLKSFQAFKQIILTHNEYGVDLEGELSKGLIDLIQISINSTPNTIIFIFDIFSLKKCSFYKKVQRFFKKMMENEEKLKVFFDCRRDSFALHSEMGVHCVNVIDLACIDAFIEQIQLFSKEKKEKNGLAEYLQTINRKKQPGLNEILKKYNAKHGENSLKEYFKEKFEKENWQEYFQQRPLDHNFIKYSAKDVEDLIEISHKMIETMKEVLSLELKLTVKENIILEFSKYISEKYIKIGCLF